MPRNCLCTLCMSLEQHLGGSKQSSTVLKRYLQTSSIFPMGVFHKDLFRLSLPCSIVLSILLLTSFPKNIFYISKRKKKQVIFHFLIAGACPLLCGGHGDYINGECECHPGWKGKECSLRHDECEVSDCSGRGHCQEGKCQCLPGFTGDFCEQGWFN